ncbi:MAG: hypothetical protein ACF8AM_19370, partial [Rhodopirellula sp. JB055]|uniref:hypothetical protein n=1 Tax=Rhodopirellula sp. JB055 TaxID=3342846 RepID=UPI00370C29A2
MTLRRFQTMLGNAVSDTSSPSGRSTKGQRYSKSRRARSERRSKLQTADRRLNHETLEKRELLAAEVVAIRPDAGALISDGDTLRNTPREINLLFNGNANLVESTIDGNIRLVRAGGDGTFGDGNEVEVSLGYLGLETPGDTSLEGRQRIVMRPASNAIHNATDPSASLPDDTYRIEITASLESEEASGNVAFNGGVDFASTFTLDRAAQVTAVVPQPVERTNTSPLDPQGSVAQRLDVIEVYFDDQTLDLNDAQDETLYRLIDMDDETAPPMQPQTALYDIVTNKVTLTFGSNLPEGNFRLDLGEEFIAQGPMVIGDGTDDSNSSVDSPTEEATNLGILSQDGIRVSSQLTGQDIAIPPYVGSQDEPGHRQIQREA